MTDEDNIVIPPVHTDEQIVAATKAISAKVAEAVAALQAATEIADEFRVSFCFSPAYGMGGTYCPKGEERSRWDGGGTLDEGEWISSSSGC